jgi:hypothetical protein
MPHPIVHAEIRSSDPDATRKFFAVSVLIAWQLDERHRRSPRVSS